MKNLNLRLLTSLIVTVAISTFMRNLAPPAAAFGLGIFVGFLIGFLTPEIKTFIDKWREKKKSAKPF
jgi:hypothetical protein